MSKKLKKTISDGVFEGMFKYNSNGADFGPSSLFDGFIVFLLFGIQTLCIVSLL